MISTKPYGLAVKFGSAVPGDYTDGLHRYTVKPERLTMPRPKITKDTDADTMPAYHRALIEGLARRYEGEELDEKLRELEFCTVEVAREVIENDGK